MSTALIIVGVLVFVVYLLLTISNFQRRIKDLEDQKEMSGRRCS